jgi:hypothetical protein
MHQGGQIDIVKRGGRRPTESFDPKKLHDSIVAACLSAGAPIGQAETIARRISEEVTQWLEARPEVTSHDLRRVAAKHLRTHHPDAGYLYEQHQITL